MATSTPRHRPSLRNMSYGAAPISTPVMVRKQGSSEDEITVGDIVEVPGGMDGKVKFVGEVKGKQGYFVGVELSRRWASRGKNDGDAEGVRYFVTSIPGAGIFLPINRAVKRASPTASSTGSFPPTPGTPSLDSFDLEDNERSTPTPSVPPRFSQSVSGRAPSPAFRPRSRPSLPRPESPLRRAQAATPLNAGGRPSLNMLSHNRLAGPRFAPSPTPAKLASSKPAAKAYISPTKVTNGQRPLSRDSDDEVAQLRAMLREKNEKISALTVEFDSHRADFRSTLDTLELASTETERVYEKRVEELLEERRALMAQGEDVESVAQQLRQLEEVVQELEEGLEDARRGEAEARGEVEFLRGEVERVRAELRRERDKGAERERAMSGGHRRSSGAAAAAIVERAVQLDQHATPMPDVAELRLDHSATAMDADKWCALCEEDGHDSISCPYEKS